MEDKKQAPPLLLRHAEQKPLARGGVEVVGGLTKMVACGRIIKINDSYVTVSLRGCVEAALEKGKKKKKRCTYIHHSLHMLADGSRVRFRSHS